MKIIKKPVIAYLHTHWDPEWYRTVDAFNIRLVEIFDLILNELKKRNMPSFYFDGQVYALLNYLKFRPEKKNLIKKLIKEEKLFVGPFFASVDNLLVSGSALIKNLEIGLEYSKKFGENRFIGYLADTFGHSKGIFKILNLFNIENAIIWRGAGEIPTDFTASHKIKTTRLVQGYYQDFLHNLSDYKKTADEIEKTLDKINEFSGETLLLPLGADHMAPLLNAKEKIENINKYLKKYEITLLNPFEYVKKADYKEKFEGEFLDNSTTYILPGVYSTRISEKVENSILEWGLLQKAYLLDYFMKRKYKKELQIITEELIKNHAHDSIYGCSTDEVHKKVRVRQLGVKEGYTSVIKNLIRDFKSKNLKEKSADFIGVFNLSNYPQNGLVKIVSDKKIKNALKIKTFNSVDDEIFYNINKNPMTEDFHPFYEYLVEVDNIGAFSFSNVKIKKPEIKHKIGDDFIENENLKLFILDNKIYATDKKTGECFEDFIEIHTTKDGGDSYNFAPLGYPEKLKFKSSKIKLCHPIKSTLELKFEENIKLNVSLTNKSEFFDIEAEIVNKKKNRKLQLVLNTKNKITETVSEDSIGTVKRFYDPDYLLFEHMPVQDKKELKTNSNPMQRFVSTNGVNIITKGLNEYEIYKNSIKITLLRSTGIISNPKNKTRGVPAGPPIECRDMQEIGYKKLCLAITFNKNEKEMFALADNFYDPFVGILGRFKIKNKTFIKSEPDLIFYGISNSGRPIFLKD